MFLMDFSGYYPLLSRLSGQGAIQLHQESLALHRVIFRLVIRGSGVACIVLIIFFSDGNSRWLLIGSLACLIALVVYTNYALIPLNRDIEAMDDAVDRRRRCCAGAGGFCSVAASDASIGAKSAAPPGVGVLTGPALERRRPCSVQGEHQTVAPGHVRRGGGEPFSVPVSHSCLSKDFRRARASDSSPPCLIRVSGQIGECGAGVR